MKNVVLKSRLQNRLRNFQDASGVQQGSANAHVVTLMKQMSQDTTLDEQLTFAGFITYPEQLSILQYKKMLILGSAFLSLCVSIFLQKTIVFMLITVGVAVYGAYFLFALFLRIRKTEMERAAYFDTPLILEEIILMIESGVALFPAMEKVCAAKDGAFANSIVRKYLQLVYRLTSGGIPMTEAFAHVSALCPFQPVRSMLVHFDVSSSIGGELLHSLQALATQVHNEWKLSVETRVKKLENMVVFPVFTAVIGMMILTAAVPMVPILNFMDSIKKNPQQRADHNFATKNDFSQGGL